MGFAMRLLRYIFIILLLSGICSCKTRYIPVSTKETETIELHDTTVVQKLTAYKDTTSIPDTVSFLSNPYAYSWAKWSNGLLQHSLGIWPNAFMIIRIPNYMIMTKRIEVPKIVEVEKKMTKWQQIKIDLCSFSIVFNVILISLIIVIWLKKRGGR